MKKNNMLWATSPTHTKILASPGAKALCPYCRSPVLAKCGEIVTWHWAHEKADCDQWFEPESAWHIGWKQLFPVEWQEVVVGSHRADIKTPEVVVELQASNISVEELEEREHYYKDMIWVLRGQDFEDNFLIKWHDKYLSFRWKWPRQCWWFAKKPIIIDRLSCLIHVKKLYPGTPCGGWGYAITKQQFLTKCGLYRYRRDVKVGN